MDDHKIVVRNTSIIINDYEIHDCERLENYFRIYKPVTHSYEYIGIYYDQEHKRLYLPRGIDVFFVEKLLNTTAYVEKDNFTDFDQYNDIMLKFLPRDDVQKSAIRFILGKGEYFATRTKTQLKVNLNTGKGKTYVSIAAFAYTGIKTIIITSSVTWLKQWKERTIEYCGLPSAEIYDISGSGCIWRLMDKTPKEIYQYKMFLVTHSTLKNFGDRYGWYEITKLFEHLRIGVKIYDEAHLNFSNLCMIDYFTNVYKTYYLTATAVRSNDEENRIYQLSFKNVLGIDLFDEENDPRTDYLGILYNSHPTPSQISACKNKYGMDRNKYVKYITRNEIFYKMLTIILHLIESKMKRDEKCLMYIGTNDGIKKVYDWIVENYPEYRGNVGIYTSIIEPEEKMLSLNKRIILSTTKSAGAAVDIKGLKVTVVLAEPFKSEVLARQSLGRTRDRDTLYIELVDKGFYHCKSYYVSKRPIYNKYARECSETFMSDNEVENRYQRILQDRMKPYPPVMYMPFYPYGNLSLNDILSM